jgi:hypothetical protein
MLNDHQALAAIFGVLVQAVLVIAALCQLLLIGIVITSFGGSRQQLIMRAVAATVGLLIYVGARSAGITIPALLLDAMMLSGRYVSGFIGSVIPAAVGLLVAAIVTSQFNNRRKHLVGARLLALLLAVTFLLYTDCLATLTDAAHTDGLRLLMPNILFAASAMLFAVFRYRIREDGAAETGAVAE